MLRSAIDIGGTFTDCVLHDSAGRYRGGSGLRKDIELRNSTAPLSPLGDWHEFAPYGLFGGEPGIRAETILNPGRNARALPSKGVMEIRAGDIVSFRLSGAGGYGPPDERDPALVADDLADGYITPEIAKQNATVNGIPQ